MIGLLLLVLNKALLVSDRLVKEASGLPSLTKVAFVHADPLLVPAQARKSNSPRDDEGAGDAVCYFRLLLIVAVDLGLLRALILQNVPQLPVGPESASKQLFDRQFVL